MILFKLFWMMVFPQDPPVAVDTTRVVSTEKFGITVVVEGIRNEDGHIVMELSDHEGIARAARKTTIRGDRAQLTFRNVPPGQWAVRLFHDENDNEVLDTNFLRNPREGYGFSNNVRGRFGPPPFEDRLFEVRGDTTISIMLIY